MFILGYCDILKFCSRDRLAAYNTWIPNVLLFYNSQYILHPVYIYSVDYGVSVFILQDRVAPGNFVIVTALQPLIFGFQIRYFFN